MKTKITRDALSCDGCEYLIGMTAEERAENRLRESDLVCEFRIPWDTDAAKREELTFHFHAPNRVRHHDCFRYWAHAPYVMTRSLKARGMDEAEIDDFLAVFLYREEKWEPGVERPKAPA